MGNSQFYTGKNEHDGEEVKTTESTAPRKMTPYDLMNMNRHQRRALGKKYGVKIPGIHLAAKKIFEEPKKSFMKPDAPVSSVMDIK